jgi:hypothetical protein
MNENLEWMQEHANVAYFKVLPQTLKEPGKTQNLR